MDGFIQAIVAQDAGDFWQTVALLAVGTGVGFWLWRRSLAGARVIEDVATSLVRSAAQGYTELCGRQLPSDEAPLTAPLTGRACTWWHYHIQRKETRRTSKGRTRTTWVTVEKDTSPHLIRFEDDTGHALVNPQGADVVANVNTVWYGNSRRPTGGPTGSGFSRLFGRYRYTERIMRPGEPMYAIGHFETRTGDFGAAEQRRQVGEQLKEWKTDRQALIERFDADGSGQVDMGEWEGARAEAERVVAGRAAEAALEPAVNLLLEPPDGRPFILSPRSQEELASHFRRRAVLWLTLFVVCGALLGTVCTARLAGG
ncbi:MAG: GIDE domain-containing protein [Gemmatimonadota bacterium]